MGVADRTVPDRAKRRRRAKPRPKEGSKRWLEGSRLGHDTGRTGAGDRLLRGALLRKRDHRRYRRGRTGRYRDAAVQVAVSPKDHLIRILVVLVGTAIIAFVAAEAGVRLAP